MPASGPSNGTFFSVHARCTVSLVSNAGDLLDIARLGKSRSAAAGLTTKRQRSGGTEELALAPLRHSSATTLKLLDEMSQLEPGSPIWRGGADGQSRYFC